ncbi:radical SAM protein, partial [Candidatus Peregrinibacteria bacterium]|nr:radical SAM protein [Candidatus Peregrinibacteria bacterium]
GLDYFKNYNEINIQKNAFLKQLELARDFDLPVVIHVRDAFADVFKILENFNINVILHCFTGGVAEVKTAIERGYMVSFSGIITYPKNHELREAVRIVPNELLMVETDGPFLSPQKYRGQRNEPAFMVETLKTLSECKGLSLKEMDQITTVNTKRVFKLKA